MTRVRVVGVLVVVALVLGCGSSGHPGAAGQAGSGGQGQAGGQGGAAGRDETGGQGAEAGAGGGGVCNLACPAGRLCCGDACVNPSNDPMNCGGCGNRCQGAKSLCSAGTCVPPPCAPTVELCAPTTVCCGNTCCGIGQICCQGGADGGVLTCVTPASGPMACPP